MRVPIATLLYVVNSPHRLYLVSIDSIFYRHFDTSARAIVPNILLTTMPDKKLSDPVDIGIQNDFRLQGDKVDFTVCILEFIF